MNQKELEKHIHSHWGFRKRPNSLDKYGLILMHLADLGWTCPRMRHALRLSPGKDEQIRVWLHRHHKFQTNQGAQPGEQNQAYRNAPEREYREVPAPPGYQGRTKSNGWVKEHRLVAEKKIGRLLKPKEVVHHIDGNPTNNHPDNLQVFPNNKAHLRHHARLNRKAYLARQERLRAEDRAYVENLLRRLENDGHLTPP